MPSSLLLRRLLGAPRALYRWHLGWLLGHRFCCLTHIGRRSGKRYETVVEVVEFDRTSRRLVVVAGFGPGTDWYRNIRANGCADVAIGRQRFPATARELDEDDADAVLAAYERRNRFVAPLVRAVLGWLLGWDYDGSPAARRRAVRQLPMLALRPR
jgi:deazaflavin-dependent oxidoreductase (nitroreductase family)